MQAANALVTALGRQWKRTAYPLQVACFVLPALLLVGLACSVLGGYVAAWLAKHDELLNGGLSSFLCVGLGIYTMASGKDSDAMWVQILMLIASPILALIGGILMRLQRRKSTMHSLQL